MLDHLGPDGIVITRRGKPVARLNPIESGCAEPIKSMKGKVKGLAISSPRELSGMLNPDTHILPFAPAGPHAG